MGAAAARGDDEGKGDAACDEPTAFPLPRSGPVDCGGGLRGDVGTGAELGAGALGEVAAGAGADEGGAARGEDAGGGAAEVDDGLFELAPRGEET